MVFLSLLAHAFFLYSLLLFLAFLLGCWTSCLSLQPGWECFLRELPIRIRGGYCHAAGSVVIASLTLLPISSYFPSPICFPFSMKSNHHPNTSPLVSSSFTLIANDSPHVNLPPFYPPVLATFLWTPPTGVPPGQGRPLSRMSLSTSVGRRSPSSACKGCSSRLHTVTRPPQLDVFDGEGSSATQRHGAER